MSLSIRFTFNDEGKHNVHQFHLASAGGWTEFKKWVDTLPSANAKLRELTNNGSAKNTLALANELKRALDNHPPKDRCLLSIAEHLAAVMVTGDTEELAEVIE